jgi:hypothetical protein
MPLENGSPALGRATRHPVYSTTTWWETQHTTRISQLPAWRLGLGRGGLLITYYCCCLLLVVGCWGLGLGLGARLGLGVVQSPAAGSRQVWDLGRGTQHSVISHCALGVERGRGPQSRK